MNGTDVLGLTLNAGSATLKFALYRPGIEGDPQRLGGGQYELHDTAIVMTARCAADPPTTFQYPRATDTAVNEDSWQHLLGWLASRGLLPAVRAVGHRVVHGGMKYRRPVVATGAILADLETLAPLAPLHLGPAIALIRSAMQALPAVDHVLCFDTDFHFTQPQVARLFALPLRFYEQGVQRFGFHGLSYEYIAGELRRLAPAVAAGRVVVAHLGSGASLCALRDGVSVATTMGLTPLDGLTMSTRCGALDPGAVLHLLRQPGMDVAAVERLLSQESGLLGLSGLSGDVRKLLASTEPAAQLALEHFVHRINAELGSLVAILGGLDGLVFTGGIGAHSSEMRRRIAVSAAWAGLRIDAQANAAGAARISVPDSSVSVWALPTDEELVIARHLPPLAPAAEAALAS